ncbi:pentapeptide repeat-containing protein [Bacillus thuringiensis]|nr:pentapeptide repeat-containing protein [Bacillus thuringiensis]
MGITVKLFGQQLIDKYFERQSEKKLENFGLGTYFLSACIQAEQSLKSLKEFSIDPHVQNHIIDLFEKSIKNKQENICNSNIILHYTPIKHPAVHFIRESCEDLLDQIILGDPFEKQRIIDFFVKDFNENIAKEVKKQFGEDYPQHFEEIQDALLKNSELRLLNDILMLEKIGYDQSEEFTYQKTYASWREVNQYRNESSETKDIIDIEEEEKKLESIENLIKQYFSQTEDSIEKILFVIADFGKGKSTFMKYYASQLAKKYQQRGEGLFPIYFNLREFDTYNQDSAYGVISDYLGKSYGINIVEDSFKSKEYCFLIDSLDESGNLTEEHIEKVISSIKRIQNLDVTKSRKNRIIITSRPIEYGLEKQLNQHKPFQINNNEDRPIAHYVSLYGFLKFQFNNWLYNSLSREENLNSESYKGIGKEIIDSLHSEERIDIYKELIDKEILTYDEMKRPIFAYILYKLIINKEELSDTNKIGIYLSFINLLTKEAKYMESVKVINLLDEFKFRNILHSTAALWLFENHSGKNRGLLTKENISNTLEGALIDKNDNGKKEQYREVEEIKFLSQCYFGQNGNHFYFQHQSFAEMLLAEYYLKVFINYALNDNTNVEEVKVRLNLGNPTAQTMEFFKGLLNLLKESISSSSMEEALKRRRLLFPMLASLCIPEYSKGLFTYKLRYTWFDEVKFDSNTTKIPEILLTKWPINEEVLNKIVELALSIIKSNSNYLLVKPISQHTSLFDNELLKIPLAVDQMAPDIDRWLGLVAGTTLYNDINKNQFFLTKTKDYSNLFKMFKNWSHFSGNAVPEWSRGCFQGIIIESNNNDNLERWSNREKQYELNGLKLRNVDFSHSTFSDIKFEQCNLYNVNFENSSFNNVAFRDCNLRKGNFENVIFKESKIEKSMIGDCNFQGISFSRLLLNMNEILQGVFVPGYLEILLRPSNTMGMGGVLANFGGKSFLNGKRYNKKGHKQVAREYPRISEQIDREHTRISEQIISMFTTLKPFISFVIKNDDVELDIIKEWFLTDDEEINQIIDETLLNLFE